MRAALSFLLLIFTTFNANADHAQGFFIGGSLSYFQGDELPLPATNQDEIEIPGIELIAGYKYNNLLGVDVRAGTGFGDDELDTLDNGAMIEYTVENYYAVYYRPEITNPEAKLYGLLGYANVETKFETVDGPNEADYSDSGLSLGIGAGWFVDDTLTFNVEIRRLLDEDSGVFDIGTMGIDYRF